MATQLRSDYGSGNTEGQLNAQLVDYGGSSQAKIPAGLFDSYATQVQSGSLSAKDAADQLFGKILTPTKNGNVTGFDSAYQGISPEEALSYKGGLNHIVDALSIAAGKGSLDPSIYIGGKAPTYAIGTNYTPPTEQALLEQTIANNKAHPPTSSTPASPTTYVPAGKFIIRPDGSEVNYAYADPALKAQADAGTLKTRNDAGYGTPPAGTQVATPTGSAQPAPTSGNKNIFNPATGQYGYQVPGGNIPEGWVAVTPGQTPSPSATTTSTTPGATPTSQTPQAQPGASTAVQPPTTALQPGSTGPEVQALQNYLVSLGFMTAEQVATGPGIYGPQTKAAVQSFQQTFGVDNSTGPGFWGPHSIATAEQLAAAQSGGTGATGSTTPGTGASAASTPAAPAKLSDILNGAGIQTTPQTSLTDIVHQLSEAYGLNDIKTQLTTLNSKYADQVANINDDPWISEAIRAKKVGAAQDKFNLEKQALMSELSAENTVVGQAITLYNAQQSNQEKLLSDQITAATAKLSATNSSQTPDIKEYNLAKNEGYTGSFTDYQKQAANLKATTKSTSTTPGSTPGLLTQTQINNGASRLGVPNTDFVKLDPQVQTFFAGANSTKFTDSVSSMSKGGTDAPSYNDVLSAINTSPYSDVVKHSMTQYLDKVAGNMKTNTTPSSSSGGGFWDTLVNIFT